MLEPNLFTYSDGPPDEINRSTLMQSVNIALTDEHIDRLDSGLVDIWLDENKGVVNVTVWKTDDPDERPARWRITAERTN